MSTLYILAQIQPVSHIVSNVDTTNCIPCRRVCLTVAVRRVSRTSICCVMPLASMLFWAAAGVNWCRWQMLQRLTGWQESIYTCTYGCESHQKPWFSRYLMMLILYQSLKILQTLYWMLYITPFHYNYHFTKFTAHWTPSWVSHW